ncbi:hypothetical protein [Brachybacterium aquaticum]|uniref:DUF3180 domain-containing protein n=1 Tax=Brachybacterium aquaticum TaxID=1432564 RepID=A0A841AAJ7_9MICO|nr:hypothetical protein [Brachybacterium aquaticum]MBB5832219.1 hypothetical protein [Brachybacterium aquaticum]
MSSAHGSSPASEEEDAPPVLPRLDAQGMPLRERADEHAVTEDPGPSPVPAWAAVALGAVLVVLALRHLLAADPADGAARPMVPLVLAAAVAVGGFSLVRVVQLVHLARSRRDRRAAGEDLSPIPWQLTEAHSLHGMWAIGVGGSLALMGVLGMWSQADGNPSGLEPGWPLLVAGAAVAGAGQLLRRAADEAWEGSPDHL